jgi:amino acid transporter
MKKIVSAYLWFSIILIIITMILLIFSIGNVVNILRTLYPGCTKPFRIVSLVFIFGEGKVFVNTLVICLGLIGGGQIVLLVNEFAKRRAIRG